MIMSFCEKFQRAVGDTTIYRLSKITGIERTKLQRIKSGQKLPTMEELELICASLCLSPEEKFNLTKEYEIAIIGEDRYKAESARQILSKICITFSRLSIALSNGVLKYRLI